MNNIINIYFYISAFLGMTSLLIFSLYIFWRAICKLLEMTRYAKVLKEALILYVKSKGREAKEIDMVNGKVKLKY
jgi:hypothetical protein